MQNEYVSLQQLIKILQTHADLFPDIEVGVFAYSRATHSQIWEPIKSVHIEHVGSAISKPLIALTPRNM